ncbi:MAG: hypothetical protein ACYCOR_00475 [Acidobacteriaceae bacterium]
MELQLGPTYAATNVVEQQATLGVPALERHYTVAELSRLWFFSENTIRRLFTKEPGVVKIARPQTRLKRGYTSMRIPERIAQRVHRRLQGLS